VTVGEWLDARSPAPPEALRKRVDGLLGDALRRDASRTLEVCLATAERLLATLLAAGSTSRDSALDLLTADALVTYAFESAADTLEHLATCASDAMRRIASIGAAASDRATA
jgi:hypothetical protein